MKYIIYKENFIQKNYNSLLLRYSYNIASLQQIRELIEKGADVNCKDSLGNTPLIISTKNLFTSCIKLLIEHGANVNIVNNNGQSALICLAEMFNYTRQKNSVENIIDILMNSNIDLNIKDKEGFDALNYNKNLKTYIKHKYPKKYKDYLIKKDAEKYNI